MNSSRYTGDVQTARSPQARPRKLPTFEVLDLTKVENGNLLAFATVRIGREPGAITVRKFRLVQQAGQPPWVSPPQEIWTDGEGRRRYKTLFSFPKEWLPPLTDCVLSAWQEYQRSGKALGGLA